VDKKKKLPGGRKSIGTPDDPTVVFTMRMEKSLRDRLRIPPPKRLLVAVREMAKLIIESDKF
jgi:hypothetical protein